MSKRTNPGAETIPDFIDVKEMLLDVGKRDTSNGHYTFPQGVFNHDGQEVHINLDVGYDRDQLSDPTGYRRIHVRIGNNEKIMIYEHRLTAEMINFEGTRLPKGTIIHHRNGIKQDNRPDNLRRVTGPVHERIHQRTRMDDRSDQKECKRHQVLATKIETTLELRQEVSELSRTIFGQNNEQTILRYAENRDKYQEIKDLNNNTRIVRWLNKRRIKKLEEQL